MPFHVGDVIDGKYRISSEIASGGMGVVFEATHLALERQVAIKVLHPHLATDGESVARFHQEAKIAGAIGHPNICETIDFGATPNGAVYLVMPLLEGIPLSQMIEGGPMGAGETVELILQVCDALTAAHNVGVVHRDLKPANIFIVELADGRKFVRLLDFGISKVLDAACAEEWTRTGTSVGTPTYMAPEQARGDKSLDQRVDVYAVGVLMYRMLTARRPFDGDSYNAIIYNIINGPLMLPRQHQPSMPQALETVILKAMSRRREDRYDSAAQLKEVLCDVEKPVASPTWEEGEFMASQTNLAAAEPFTPTGTLSGVDYIQAQQKNSALSRRKTHWMITVAVLMLLIAGVGLAVGLHSSSETNEKPPESSIAHRKVNGEPVVPQPAHEAHPKVITISKIDTPDATAEPPTQDSEFTPEPKKPVPEQKVSPKRRRRPQKHTPKDKEVTSPQKGRKADGRFKTQIIVDYD